MVFFAWYGRRVKTRTALAVMALLFVRATDAAAQEAPAAKPAADPPRTVSLVTDLRDVTLGLAVLTTEVDLGRQKIFPFVAPRDTSLAFTFGVGRPRTRQGRYLSLWEAPCREDATTCSRESTLVVGMQALTYVLGDFRSGWQVGVEASFHSYFGGTLTQNYPYTHATPTTTGIAPRGVFVPGIVSGYKAVLWGGVTVGPQAAIDMWIATNGAPTTAAARFSLDAGWSF